MQTSVREIENAPVLIDIDQLRESPLNPRKYISEQGIDELTASMRKNGFHAWTPIVARPQVDESGAAYYEIAAGHRRRLAAIKAGLDQVPVIVREMSDDEFLEVLNFDNSGREDVHPLHEGIGWQGFMDRTGATLQDIADRVGKTRSYVHQRVRYANLIPEAQQAFLQRGKAFSSHAILIARLSPDAQPLALRYCTPPEWAGEEAQVSTRDLAAWIKRNIHTDLIDAPFDVLTTDLIPNAGSCVECPKRVGNFLDFNPANDLPNICTDPDCYHDKLAAYRALQQPEEPEAAPAPKPKPAKQPTPEPTTDAPSPAIPDTAEEDRRVEQKIAAERKARLAVITAILPKVTWPPSREDVAYLLSDQVDNLPEECDALVESIGIDPKIPGRQMNASERQLAQLVILLVASVDLDGDFALSHGCDQLTKLTKRYNIDVPKLRAEMEGGARKEADGAGKAKVQPHAKVKSPPKKKAAAKKTVGVPAGVKKQGLASKVKGAIAGKGKK